MLLAVVAPDGSSLLDGDPVVQGQFVTQALKGSELNGAYYASFQVVGADRHPIVGRVDYVVAEASVATDNPAGVRLTSAWTTRRRPWTRRPRTGGSGSGLLLLRGGPRRRRPAHRGDPACGSAYDVLTAPRCDEQVSQPAPGRRLHVVNPRRQETR